MDDKTAVKILRDEDRHSTSPENVAKDIWTNLEITIDEAESIADLIERQAKRIADLIDDNGQQHIGIMLLSRKKEQQEQEA